MHAVVDYIIKTNKIYIHFQKQAKRKMEKLNFK